MIEHYLAPLIVDFNEAANYNNSASMRLYMRNKFEFLGIKAPQRKKIQKQFLKKYKLPDYTDLSLVVKKLWELPYREYQYFAIDLHEKYKKKWTEDYIETIEYMLNQKQWWDTVDSIATRIAGLFFQSFPQLGNEKTKTWINANNIWLMRAALLFQLKYKKKTNQQQLFDYILTVSDNYDFFVQKAIGWALREYSKVASKAVENFIETYELPALSQREALKHIKKTKK